MSLVNDMLKDLDQRRSGADGGNGQVRLTPASEFHKGSNKHWPIYMLGLLILVAGGLGYTWMQLDADRPARGDSDNSSATGNFEVADSPSVSQPSSQQFTEPASDVVSTSPQLAQDSNSADPVSYEIDPTTNAPLDILSQAVQRRANNAPVIEFYRPEIADGVVAVVDEPISDTDASEELVDIRAGEGLDASVKDEAEISEDQRDAMAVQTSLRLIAENKVSEAYENFANYIVENRYAHQSRETYAKLLLNSGELEIANNLIEQGLELAPNNSGFKKVKARLLIQEGHLLDAVSLLVAKAPLVSEDLEYHEILASAQLATKDYAGAAISYSELVGADQTRGKFWYGYAASQELLGNLNVAKQAYARAVQQPSLSTNLRRRSQDRLLALRD